MKFIPAILCVDDDEDDLSFITETIEANSAFQALTRRNGDEALRLLREFMKADQLPSLVIVDINMPGMDGKEIVHRIRSMDGLQQLPIAVFSTSSRQKDREFFERAGVPFVTKPFEYKQMAGAIHQLLSHSVLPSA